MKVLVIGNGFLGSEIIKLFGSNDFDVMVVSRSINPGFVGKKIEGDFLKQDLINHALEWAPDVVIQTAWITDHKKYLNDPLNKDYASFTIDLANRIVNTKVKHLVVLGSAAEYGQQATPIVAGATSLSPESFYAEQKIRAFKSIYEIFKDNDKQLTWGRVFQPYGSGQDEQRLIPHLIKSMKTKSPIRLENPNSCLDWISSRDVASAILWATCNKLPVELDICTGIGTSNLDVLKTVQIALGLPDIDPSQLDLNYDEPPKNVVAASNSPIFISGWRPSDLFSDGVRWAVNS
jgi:nucleoside-diphosphate-sugar epimerase